MVWSKPGHGGDPFPPTLEPEHDCGPGLVLGPAEADASEGGGDPLSQQVPPEATPARQARQVRGHLGGKGVLRERAWGRTAVRREYTPAEDHAPASTWHILPAPGTQ